MKRERRKKTLMIIGAGLEQAIVIRRARRHGLRVVAVDANANAVGLRAADIAVTADTANVRALVALGKKYRVDGVMTHGVEIPGTVARVAKALGLPHLDPIVADRATDKTARIKALTRAGIPMPAFAEARTVAEAKRKAKKLGFPVVVKPVDSAGARGVQKVSRVSEVEVAFEEAVKYSKTRRVLMEQFLRGREISTESVILEGKIVTTGFADRNYSRAKEFAPYFVEDGHSVPSSLTPAVRRKVIRTVEKAIRALGIDWGVAKGDILIAGSTVYVIEMAARTSGGWFAAGTVPIATGVHLTDILTKLSLGEPVAAVDAQPIYNRAACQRYVIPNQEGTFVRLEGVAEARRMPGARVLQIFHMPKKGERIHKARNNAERFGHLIAEGRTLAQATRRCESAMRKIRIILQEG